MKNVLYSVLVFCVLNFVVVFEGLTDEKFHYYSSGKASILYSVNYPSNVLVCRGIYSGELLWTHAISPNRTSVAASGSDDYYILVNSLLSRYDGMSMHDPVWTVNLLRLPFDDSLIYSMLNTLDAVMQSVTSFSTISRVMLKETLLSIFIRSLSYGSGGYVSNMSVIGPSSLIIAHEGLWLSFEAVDGYMRTRRSLMVDRNTVQATGWPAADSWIMSSGNGGFFVLDVSGDVGDVDLDNRYIFATSSGHSISDITSSLEPYNGLSPLMYDLSSRAKYPSLSNHSGMLFLKAQGNLHVGLYSSNSNDLFVYPISGLRTKNARDVVFVEHENKQYITWPGTYNISATNSPGCGIAKFEEGDVKYVEPWSKLEEPDQFVGIMKTGEFVFANYYHSVSTARWQLRLRTFSPPEFDLRSDVSVDCQSGQTPFHFRSSYSPYVFVMLVSTNNDDPVSKGIDVVRAIDISTGRIVWEQPALPGCIGVSP